MDRLQVDVSQPLRGVTLQRLAGSRCRSWLRPITCLHHQLVNGLGAQLGAGWFPFRTFPSLT
jgi:hypothetical protein